VLLVLKTIAQLSLYIAAFKEVTERREFGKLVFFR